jgi:serine/threonine protein phosphatase PrpC
MQTIDYIADSFQGTTHTANQDGILIIQEDQYKIFIVFDGVSLSENQIKGVQLATEFISENYVKFYKEEVFQLREMMFQVNNTIICSKWKDALTTYCAAVMMENNYLTISHLGDSRIYSIEDNNLIQQTEDDSLFPGSNVLTKCLGIERLTNSDFYNKEIKIVRGRILICTDGLFELIEKESNKLIDILNHSDLDNMKGMLKKIISGRNRDDATYILIDVKE